MFIAGALILAACTDGAPRGVGEPFFVRGAQFFEGKLPGTPPLEGTAGAAGTTAAEEPAVTALELKSIVMYQGQGGKKLSGRLSTDAVAVGLQLDEAGTGYWVLPAGSPDSSSNGELTWDATADLGLSVQPGMHSLSVVALGSDGVAGRQLTQQLCVAERVPDGLNACDPNLPVPEVVFSLRWDANVDLDLVVVTPDRQIIDGKHPLTEAVDSAGRVSPTAGVFDRDSNAGCAIDGVRFENLVFKTVKPSQGVWGLYVDLFDSCKQPAVHFEVGAYVATTDAEGKRHLEPLHTQDGVLLASQASGGDGHGWFMFEVKF
jgi:hypothetical protein